MSSKTARNQTVGAFVLNNEATYDWVIFVYVPSADGNSKTKLKFKAKFRHVSPERRLEILEEFRANAREREKLQQASRDADNDEAVDNMQDVLSFETALLDDVLVGFSGILGPDGKEVGFDEDTKKALLANAWARDAMFAAYPKSLAGRSSEGN